MRAIEPPDNTQTGPPIALHPMLHIITDTSTHDAHSRWHCFASVRELNGRELDEAVTSPVCHTAAAEVWTPATASASLAFVESTGTSPALTPQVMQQLRGRIDMGAVSRAYDGIDFSPATVTVSLFASALLKTLTTLQERLAAHPSLANQASCEFGGWTYQHYRPDGWLLLKDPQWRFKSRASQ